MYERTIRQLKLLADEVQVGLPHLHPLKSAEGQPQYSGETPLLSHTPVGKADNALTNEDCIWLGAPFGWDATLLHALLNSPMSPRMTSKPPCAQWPGSTDW